MRSVSIAAVAAFLVMASGAQAVTTPLWSNYKWARTSLLTIKLGDNVSSAWDPYRTSAISDWSKLSKIDFVATKGSTAASTCAPVFGTVQACNANYGATGWLGLANVWLAGAYIIEATVRLNEYYFSQPRYNTGAWRQMVMCQEVGHTLGLAHADTNFSNLNLGTCMDYTNDPSGLRGTNGTLANEHPYAGDYKALNGLYSVPGGNQVASTQAQYLATFALGVDGDIDMITGVPEASGWALMIAGFGLAGTMLRRRRKQVVTA